MSSTDGSQNPVLLSTFNTGKKKIRVILHEGNIVWDNVKPPSGKLRAIKFPLSIQNYLLDV